jgi:hypothetical protein
MGEWEMTIKSYLRETNPLSIVGCSVNLHAIICPVIRQSEVRLLEAGKRNWQLWKSGVITQHPTKILNLFLLNLSLESCWKDTRWIHAMLRGSQPLLSTYYEKNWNKYSFCG